MYSCVASLSSQFGPVQALLAAPCARQLFPAAAPTEATSCQTRHLPYVFPLHVYSNF